MHTAEGEGGRRGHLTYPLKSLQKLDHKNTIKHENWGPPYYIFSQPQVPPTKEFEMTVCINVILVVFVLLTILWQVQNMV
jgi:hypothetical protein